ncbi:MAG: HipA family kinase [Bryobacteraceae bacterium]
MPIRARRFIRKMRGGAQSHLIEGEDGEFYIVKFLNNPQHRRILINEWLANAFLRYLQIFVPETAIVELTSSFLAENPDVCIILGAKHEPALPGLHFGSRVAVHPDRVAIYDFLPDSVLGKIENRVDFIGALVFDKWIGNADSRQAIFFRAKARGWTPVRGEAPQRIGFFAQMIDEGFVFNGPHWAFQDSPLQGVYFRTSVYDEVRSLASFQPWLDLVRNFPVEVVDEAWKQIPRSWYDSDRDDLETLLEQLLKRRGRVESLIQETRKGRAKTFENWR